MIAACCSVLNQIAYTSIDVSIDDSCFSSLLGPINKALQQLHTSNPPQTMALKCPSDDTLPTFPRNEDSNRHITFLIRVDLTYLK
jgi:hypothetical protein